MIILLDSYESPRYKETISWKKSFHNLNLCSSLLEGKSFKAFLQHTSKPSQHLPHCPVENQTKPTPSHLSPAHTKNSFCTAVFLNMPSTSSNISPPLYTLILFPQMHHCPQRKPLTQNEDVKSHHLTMQPARMAGARRYAQEGSDRGNEKKKHPGKWWGNTPSPTPVMTVYQKQRQWAAL